MPDARRLAECVKAAEDLALRGPRPPAGIAGLDAHFADPDRNQKLRELSGAWAQVRPSLEGVERLTITTGSGNDVVHGVGNEDRISTGGGNLISDKGLGEVGCAVGRMWISLTST